MKDPLQRRETPYEVLGVGLTATPEDINRAFQSKLAARGNVQKLTAARQVLGRPIDRALIDLFDYRDALFGRLRPNPLIESDALGADRRAQTAASWIKALRSGFPNPALTHGLGVLHYWWALTETEELAKSASVKSDSTQLERLWEMAIGCWSSALTDPGFWRDWPGIPATLHEELRTQIRQRLSGDLHRLARQLTEAGNVGIAKRLERFDFRYDDEIEIAKAMLAAKLNSNRGGLCAGKLLLDRLELTDTVSSSVENALQHQPGDRNLMFLRQALGSYSEIWFLLRKDQFDVAMEAIERLSLKQRNASEVRTLECKALQGQGSHLAALGKLSEALGRWELALAKAESQETRESIRDNVEQVLGEAAARVADREARDSAIELLERGETMLSRARVTTSPAFKIRLAELLCVRGIEIINQAQEEFSANDSERARVIGEMERGIADLRRASTLGLERAKGQLKTALEVLEAVRTWTPSPSPELVSRYNSAIQRANQALEKLQKGTIGVTDAMGALETSIKELDLLAARGLDRARESAAELRQAVDQLRKNPVRSTTAREPRSTAWLARLPNWIFTFVEQCYFVAFAWSGLVLLQLNATGVADTTINLLSRANPFVVFGFISVPIFLYLDGYRVLGFIMGCCFIGVAILTALFPPSERELLASRQQESSAEMKSAPNPQSPAAKQPDNQVQSSTKAATTNSGKRNPKAPMSTCPELKTWTGATTVAKQSEALEGLDGFFALSGADCRNKAILATTELAEALPAMAPESRPWATLLVAASFEALEKPKSALPIYEMLAELDEEFAVTGKLRSMELSNADRKAVEQVYNELRAAPDAENWFKTTDGWHRMSTHRVANLGLLAVRSDLWSIKLFEGFIHWITPSPDPHRYLFVMLGMILTIIVIDLPLAILNGRVAAVTARLQYPIQKIQKTYADNPAEVQRHVAALYAKNGIKPGLGCLGVILEFAICGGALYLFSRWAPRLELDHARFLWISNLVQPDGGILWIWGGIAVLTSYMAFKQRNIAVAGRWFVSALFPLTIVGLAWYYEWPAYVMLAWALLLLSWALSRGIVTHYVAQLA
jgi:membrane protein insertase Oxa1/YidC/SpoIIIJ